MKLLAGFIGAFSLTALCVCTLTAVGQRKEKKPLKTKEQYLSLSEKQKTAGWITVGLGAVLFGVGAAIDRGELARDGFLFSEYKNDEKKLILKGLGFTSLVAGGVLLIVSRQNKKRAS